VPAGGAVGQNSVEAAGLDLPGSVQVSVEGKVTLIDGLLASAVLVGLVLNVAFGPWWADPLAGLVLVFYRLRAARAIFAGQH